MQKWWALLLFLAVVPPAAALMNVGCKVGGEPEQALYQQWGAPVMCFI